VKASETGGPSTGFLVWHLSLRWQVQLSRALAPLGITHTDYAVLASLHGLARAGIRPSQRELADVSGLEPMYVSKRARALEAAGLVERRPHPADPRANELSLTDRGNDVVTAGRRVVVDLEEQRLAVLGGRSGQRAAQFKDALTELLRHAGETSTRPAPSPPTQPEPTKETPR
jgi:DNA-binding MarR family transcriptional regulator